MKFSHTIIYIFVDVGKLYTLLGVIGVEWFSYTQAPNIDIAAPGVHHSASSLVFLFSGTGVFAKAKPGNLGNKKKSGWSKRDGLWGAEVANRVGQVDSGETAPSSTYY